MSEPIPAAMVIDGKGVPAMNVRAALNAAASAWCSGVQREGDEPCSVCRGFVRDLVLVFLENLPALTVTSPMELRLRIAREGSDG